MGWGYNILIPLLASVAKLKRSFGPSTAEQGGTLFFQAVLNIKRNVWKKIHLKQIFQQPLAGSERG